MGTSAQLGVRPNNSRCKKYNVIKPPTQDMHKVALLTLEMVNKNYITVKMSMQKKFTEVSLCRLTC
jgi:hypothetical protein